MMTVDLSNQAVELLETLGRKEGREPTAILRRAIGLYAHLSKECAGTDNEIAVTDDKGRIIKRMKWK